MDSFHDFIYRDGFYLWRLKAPDCLFIKDCFNCYYGELVLYFLLVWYLCIIINFFLLLGTSNL